LRIAVLSPETLTKRTGRQPRHDAALGEQDEQGDRDGNDDDGRVDKVVVDLEAALAERRDRQAAGVSPGWTPLLAGFRLACG
jgi:hypothetical protein